MDFIICECTFATAFAASLIWLVLRNKSPYIARRSPIILVLSLSANFLQSMAALTQVFEIEKYFSPEYQEKCFLLYRIRQSLIFFFHHVVFMTYMLRSYRLYLLFKIEKTLRTNGDSQAFIHRTGQKWLLKTLFLTTIPVLALIAIGLTSCDIAFYLPSTEDSSGKIYSKAEYILISFLEQLGFLFAIFSLRMVNDDYNMSKELTFAGVLWYSVPFFSVFPMSLDRFSLLPTIIRNGCLWIISFVRPLIVSHYFQEQHDVITIEMLRSFESILQNSVTLDHFENFLMAQEESCKNGLEMLCLYMQCVNYINNPETTDISKLTTQIINSNCFPYYYTADGGDTFAQFISKVKISAFKHLNSEYFPDFLVSNHYKALQRLIYNKEIYTGRLLIIGL